MAIQFQLDEREMKRALHEYARATQKDEPAVLNRTALNIAIKAFRNTPKASRADIESFRNSELSNRVVAKKLRERQGTFTKAEFDRYKRQMISARKRAIGFIKSGWIPAMKTFSIATGKSPRQTRPRGKPKGTAIVARKTWRSKAELSNNVRPAEKVGVEAFTRATQQAFQDMRQFAQRRFQQRADKFRGRAIRSALTLFR